MLHINDVYNISIGKCQYSLRENLPGHYQAVFTGIFLFCIYNTVAITRGPPFWIFMQKQQVNTVGSIFCTHKNALYITDIF